MMTNPDPEANTKQLQSLLETQSQIEILNNQILKINKHIATQKLRNKRAEAAIASLDNTDAGGNAYKQVSRLFIRRCHEDLKTELQNEMETTANDLPKLDSVKSQLVAKLGGLSGQYIELNKQIRATQFKS